jgi:hypothetical protein
VTTGRTAEIALIIWGWLSFFNIVIRSTVLYLVFHGKADDDMRHKYVITADRYGGIFNYAVAVLAIGIVLAPFAFIGSMRAVDQIWK